ncbi:hypothetical protein MLD38_023125 [Melastoma candidum]|uniref:Uncharacterized protein n=1 Tax=Melastoma candidum TaxID=119954 RepID=A0ACB9QKN1_9MYRT|nr:hypothetical protein MLD38_023125 [Melastoma candidum]
MQGLMSGLLKMARAVEAVMMFAFKDLRNCFDYVGALQKQTKEGDMVDCVEILRATSVGSPGIGRPHVQVDQKGTTRLFAYWTVWGMTTTVVATTTIASVSSKLLQRNR